MQQVSNVSQYLPSNLLLLLQVDGPTTNHQVTVVDFRKRPRNILDFSLFLSLYIQDLSMLALKYFSDLTFCTCHTITSCLDDCNPYLPVSDPTLVPLPSTLHIQSWGILKHPYLSTSFPVKIPLCPQDTVPSPALSFCFSQYQHRPRMPHISVPLLILNFLPELPPCSS